MRRSRLLILIALIACHVTCSLGFMYSFAYQTGLPELLCWANFFPMYLIGQTGQDHPDLGALVGVPETSPFWPVLFTLVNSLLLVTPLYGTWLCLSWVWSKVGSRDRGTE
jgi:hypothetical protein